MTGSAMAMAPATLPSTPAKIAVAPSSPQLVGRRRERADVDAVLAQEGRVAEHDLLALDRAERALAGRRVEVAHRRRGDAALLRGVDDGERERMLAGALDAGREAQDLGLGEALRRDDRRHRRLALGQRAGLVDDERVDLLHALQRLGVLDQHAGLGAAPDADHDRHRRGEPERAGTGDDQHGDRGDEAVGEPRLGPPDRPGGEGEQRDRDHRRHELAGDLVGQPLDRRAAALRLGDQLHDLRQHGVAPDLARLDDERAGLVHGAADDVGADLLGDRHRLARDHRLVDGAAAFDDDAVDRHLLARAHPQAVADLDGVELDLLLGCRRPDAPGRLGREVEQRADGAAGALAGPQLEHLAEQDQHGDHGRRLEIDRDRAVVAAEGGREDAGREGRDDAVDPGDAGAHGDQREHVEVARDERLPAAHEERPAGPQHDRRGQQPTGASSTSAAG